MPHDPWMLLGWLIVLIILATLLIVPIVGVCLLRTRRRAMRTQQAMLTAATREKIERRAAWRAQMRTSKK